MPANNDRFLYIIDQHSPTTPYLPAIHIASVANVDSILKTRKIGVSLCKVFNINLAYFFYGKPTYAIKQKYPGASRNIAEAAVCFALDAAVVSRSLRKLFAFDTGAFHGDRYDQFVPTGLTIDDFEITPTALQTLGKYINAFYGDNNSYYLGNMRTNLQISQFDLVSRAILDLAAAPLSTPFDERVASAEMQVNADIPLSAGSVRAVVAPSTLDVEPDFKDACRDWGIKPTYYRFVRATSDARTAAIFQCLGDLYQDWSLI